MALTHSWHDMVHDMRDEMHDLATITHVEPARQAFLMLWGLFVVAPILFGIDKFAGVLTSDWEGYLATWVDDLLPGHAPPTRCTCIGVVEIAAGLLVLRHAPHRRVRRGAVAGRHHRQPGVAPASTTTSRCATSG